MESGDSAARENNEKLRDHRKIQEELTEDMLNYSARLKEGSRQLSQELHRSNKILDDTATLTDKNLEEVRKETLNAENMGSRSLYVTLLSYGLVLVVMGSFVMLFWFIRMNPV